MFKLFILFAVMPIIEIALLLEVGDIIGGWNTVAVVIVTAFVGASLVKQQGLQTFISAQQKMQTGQIPSQEVAEGLLLLVAGVLLVTPGFVTDVIGLLFSMPFTRPAIARQVAKQILSNVKMRGQYPGGGFGHQGTSYSQSSQHNQYQEDVEQRFREAFNQHQQAANSQSKEGEVLGGEIIEGEVIEGELTHRTVESQQEKKQTSLQQSTPPHSAQSSDTPNKHT